MRDLSRLHAHNNSGVRQVVTRISNDKRRYEKLKHRFRAFVLVTLGSFIFFYSTRVFVLTNGHKARMPQVL